VFVKGNEDLVLKKDAKPIQDEIDKDATDTGIN